LSFLLQGSYYTAGTPIAVSAADGVNNNPANTLPINGTITMNSIGQLSPSSFTTCQPTIICNYIVRVI